ncbi:hypothetical protein K310107B6_30270 [Mediterraneibacter gnavus]
MYSGGNDLGTVYRLWNDQREKGKNRQALKRSRVITIPGKGDKEKKMGRNLERFLSVFFLLPLSVGNKSGTFSSSHHFPDIHHLKCYNKVVTEVANKI